MNAPDIVSKIREALDAEMEHQGAMMVRTLDSEAMAKALLPQLSVMLAKEPVSADLDTLRMVRDNLKTLMPFVLVQGDAVHRVNPGSQQVVNANCAWAVSNGERSAHKVRALVDNLNNSYGALDALITRMEQNTVPDINKCPKCGGAADNGHDREVPPNPYYCTKCTQKQNTGSDVGTAEDASTRKDEAVGVIAATTSEIRDTSSASYAAGQSERHCEAASAPQITNPAQLGDGRNTAPAASDVDELVRKVEILSTKAIVEVSELRDLIRAHFNEPEGEKHHG